MGRAQAGLVLENAQKTERAECGAQLAGGRPFFASYSRRRAAECSAAEAWERTGEQGKTLVLVALVNGGEGERERERGPQWTGAPWVRRSSVCELKVAAMLDE